MPVQRADRHLRPLWPAPARPARQALDRERVVRAALELLDEVGLENLSMRRLAEHLGVRSPSLYWHVRDKDELLNLIADAICAELGQPALGESLPADLETVAWEYRRVLRSHRDAAVVLASTLPLGPNRLRLADRMLGVLLRAGFPPAVAARAGLLFTDFVTNFVIEEGRTQAAARAFEQVEQQSLAPDRQDALQHAGFAAVRAWFEALPADEFPNLVALAPHLTEDDPDERFRFGLRILVNGLMAQLRQA